MAPYSFTVLSIMSVVLLIKCKEGVMSISNSTCYGPKNLREVPHTNLACHN